MWPSDYFPQLWSGTHSDLSQPHNLADCGINWFPCSTVDTMGGGDCITRQGIYPLAKWIESAAAYRLAVGGALGPGGHYWPVLTSLPSAGPAVGHKKVR
jgi:hypothetical protein